MGAKSRKGYGSLVTQVADAWTGSSDGVLHRLMIADLRESLTDLRRNHGAPDQPEYTALSAQARQVLVPSDKNDSDGSAGPRRSRAHAVSELGAAKERLFGKDSEKNFRR